ncbi:MAG: 50S ribosomal protein L10 [Candidatus Omnitrophota bacterium]
MAKLAMSCKGMMVKEISSRLNNASLLIVTSYKGLSAQDLNELRKNIRSVSGEYIVARNAMARKALAEGSNNRLGDYIKGEVGIALDRKKDPIDIPKILARFLKEHENLKIHGGIMNGEIISEQDIMSIAALSSRDVLLGKLANVLNAPIQGLAGVLNAIICKIVYALKAVKEKKEKTGDTKAQEENKPGEAMQPESGKPAEAEIKIEEKPEDVKEEEKKEE